MRPIKWVGTTTWAGTYSLPTMTQRYTTWRDAYQHATSIITSPTHGLNWDRTGAWESSGLLLLKQNSSSPIGKMNSGSRWEACTLKEVCLSFISDDSYGSTGSTTLTPCLPTSGATLACSLARACSGHTRSSASGSRTGWAGRNIWEGSRVLLTPCEKLGRIGQIIHIINVCTLFDIQQKWNK